MTTALEEFLKIIPEIRCFALVGQFLYHWSELESTLNNCIERAFDLTAIQGVVLTRNVQLRDKINMLKSIVHLVLPAPEAGVYRKKLSAIHAFATANRNMIAHDSFIPDDKGDGVQFFVIKAKGEISFPEMRWSIEDFQTKVEEMDAYNAAMKKLTPVLETFSHWRNAQRAIANATPTNWLTGQDQEDSPSPLPLETQHSPTVPSTPKIAPQTPPSSGLK